MKKVYIAILSIITVVCIIVGTVYHVGGFLSNFSFFGHEIVLDKDFDSTKVSETKDLTISGSQVRILLTGSVMDFTLEKGSSFQASYECARSLVPDIQVKTGQNATEQVIITQADSFKNLGNRMKCDLTITVPEDVEIVDLQVELDLGNMDISQIEADTADIRLDLGDLDVKNCSFTKSTIETDLGDMKIADSNLGNATVESDLGNVKVLDCEFEDLEVVADLGNIEVKSKTDLTDFQIQAEVDMGNLEINGKNYKEAYEQAGSDGRLIVNASMGNATVTY